MGVSKVIYDGNTLIDLTNDSIKPDKVLVGYSGHGADGEPFDGTCTFDVDSSGATAAVGEVLKGKTFGKGGKIQTGTMPNNGAVNGTISAKDDTFSVAHGYHDGSGKVGIASAEKEKIIPGNIREGVTVLGVTGTMSGTEGANPQAKTVTPSAQVQEVLPDEGYNYLSSVTVNAIPYSESENNVGGTTVTIA